MLISGCYIAWVIDGLLYAGSPIVAVLALSLPVALHSSLQHEVLHGHPTRRASFNEALIFLPLNFFYPYRRYKLLHLRHHADHRLTDPYDDPESYYLAHRDWVHAPHALRTLLTWNNTLAGRLLFGPAIALVFFLRVELKSASHVRGRITKDWILHAFGAFPMLLVVSFVFRMPLWAYSISVYLAASIISVRSFCEHQWSEAPAGRSIIVESRILRLLFLNNNLHLVHHVHPAAPWYDLPRLYNERRSEWSRMNGGYVFRGYADVLRRYGLRPKEPVAHPALRLVDED